MTFSNKWESPKRKTPPMPLNREVQLRNKIKKTGIDGLTGLLDRKLLEPRLNELISELKIAGVEDKRTSNRVGFMVIFLDLDGFKEINDKYGHTTGDTALALFGKRLNDVVKRKEIDRVYRYGGDEFIIVLPIEGTENISNEKLEGVFQRIKHEVNKDLFIAEGEKIEASMGYSVFKKGDKDKTSEKMIQEADDEMYKNKRARKSGQAI